MILLENIVQIFDLTDLDGRFALSVDGMEGRQIGPAFVACQSPRRTVKR